MLTFKYKIKRIVLYGIQNDTIRVEAIVFCSLTRKEPVAGVFVFGVWMLPDGKNHAAFISGTTSGPSG